MSSTEIDHREPIAAPSSPGLQRAFDALLEIRRGLSRVLDELPDVRRAVDVERALKIDRPLAWRVFKAAKAIDAPEVMQHLPTTNQLLRVLGLARRRGVQPEVVDAIETAIARFDESVRAAAGDRVSFGALLSGHIKQGVSPIEQRVRRDAFRSNAHLWGNQCQTLAFLVALHPGVSSTALDMVTLRGWVDLHTSRPQRATQLFSRFQLRPAGEERSAARTGTALPASSLDVVKGYGTASDAELVTKDGSNGRQETHVQLPGVGREGRVTLFLRQQIDAGTPVAERMRMMHIVCVPAEVLLFDLLVPPGWADPRTIDAAAYARPHDVPQALECRNADQIACPDVPTFFEGLTSVPHTPDVPRWPEVVEHVLEERGWLGGRFDLIRFRTSYPILHSGIVLEAMPRLA